jgi:hypothetical protein
MSLNLLSGELMHGRRTGSRDWQVPDLSLIHNNQIIQPLTTANLITLPGSAVFSNAPPLVTSVSVLETQGSLLFVPNGVYNTGPSGEAYVSAIFAGIYIAKWDDASEWFLTLDPSSPDDQQLSSWLWWEMKSVNIPTTSDPASASGCAFRLPRSLSCTIRTGEALNLAFATSWTAYPIDDAPTVFAAIRFRCICR